VGWSRGFDFGILATAGEGSAAVRRLSWASRPTGQDNMPSRQPARRRRYRDVNVGELAYLLAMLCHHVFAGFDDSLCDRLPESHGIERFVLAQAAQDGHL
jgi:hypothetical protein